MIYYMDYSWTEEEQDEFKVDAIVGWVVADGVTSYANLGIVKKGTVLYRLVWEGYPPDMVWYEPEENLGSENEALVAFKAQMDLESQLDDADAREEAELDELEDVAAMPSA